MGCLFALSSQQLFCFLVWLKHSSSARCNEVSPVVLAKTFYNGPNIYLDLLEYVICYAFLQPHVTVVML